MGVPTAIPLRSRGLLMLIKPESVERRSISAFFEA